MAEPGTAGAMRVHLRLLRYLWPYRRRLAVALLCMALYAVTTTALLGTVMPLFQVLFERAGTTHGTAEMVVPGPRGTGPVDSLAAVPLTRSNVLQWPELVRARAERSLVRARLLVAVERLCVFLLMIVLLKNLADYFQSYLMAAIEQAALRDLRNHLHAHLQRLSLSFFHARRTGNLMSRLTNDFEYLRMALAASTSTGVKDGLTLIGSLALAFWASTRLALLAVFIFPPTAFALAILGRRMRTRSTRAQERMGELSAQLQESLSGVRVVKAFQAETFEQRRFEAANEAFTRAYVRMRRIAAAARPVAEVGLVTVAIVMLWLGAREIEGGGLQASRFSLFVMALLASVSPIRSLADVNTNVQQGVAAAMRVFGVIDTAPEIVDRPGAQTAAPFRDRVVYDDVHFAYDGETPVLEGLSFEVRRGEVVALVGSSGAGKSTAMDLLPRFYDPRRGRVTMDGVDVRDLTVASLRAQLGIVTQETFLFHDSVRDNIAYGLGAASDTAVRAAAEAAYAHDFIERLPAGYDTVIGERGVTLSGGERQRLAIARALLKNPPILLLDEATSALDVESERLVQAALERLMRDRTVLVIAHRLATVQHADRIVVIERGRVVATGTHRELLEQEGLYRRLHELQFAV